MGFQPFLDYTAAHGLCQNNGAVHDDLAILSTRCCKGFRFPPLPSATLPVISVLYVVKHLGVSSLGRYVFWTTYHRLDDLQPCGRPITPRMTDNSVDDLYLCGRYIPL